MVSLHHLICLLKFRGESRDTPRPSTTSQAKTYNIIRQDILANKNSLFLGIIKKYTSFLTDFFEIQLQYAADDRSKNESVSPSNQDHFRGSPDESPTRAINQTSYTPDDHNKSSMYTSIYERPFSMQKELICRQLDSHFRNLYNPSQASLIILQQFDFIIKLLRHYVEYVYQDILDEKIGQEPDNVPERIICVQRIIEQLLITKDTPQYYFLQHLAQKAYMVPEFTSSDCKASVFAFSQDMTHTEPILDKTLHPKSQPEEFLLEIGSMEDSSLHDEFEIKPNQQKQLLLQTISRSDVAVRAQQIPYYQTFPMLHKIIKVKKFWKKFKLIERLDMLIISLFMGQRTASQYNKLFDMISAEDSKSDVLLFVLYTYQKTYPSVNLHNDLYLELKLMNEFDGCLHQDLKYIYCPDFLRFYCMLELLTLSKLCN